MSTIVETGAAGMLTGYLVALFKLAFPSARPWALVLVAFLGGIGSAVVVGVSQGQPLTTQNGATWVIQGIAAAAVAAGLTRTDAKAEEARGDAI